jgi:FeS assembly SUF system protein
VEDAETPAEKLERKRDYLEGFLAQKPQGDNPTVPGGALYESVVDALREIFDPEIPVNIYDLGLIYGVDVGPEADVMVTMTLTTPHCPVAESMPAEVELRVSSVPGVRDAEVTLVWDPAVGSLEDERRSAARAGDAVMSESKLRQRPAAVVLTVEAEARIAELMAKAPAGAIGVRLSTPRRGCSGLAYSVDYVTEEQPFDEKISTPGGTFYIDGAACST